MGKRGILILLVVGIGAVIGWRFVSPGQDVATPGTGAPIAEVDVPALSAAESAGKSAYDANCAACHGANAAGQDGVAPPLVHVIYEPSHHADAAFFRAARNGVRAHHWPFGDMPRIDGIAEEDLAGIVTYIRALQRANGIE